MDTDAGRGEWLPQEEANIDDRVLVRTEAGREFYAHLGWYGADENGNDCTTWAEQDEGTAPSCWSDGICWLTNEDGVKSDQVVSFFRPTYPTES